MQRHNLSDAVGDASTLLEDGELKNFEIEDKSIVLARRGDKYYAFDASCPHYGGPLHEGVLHGNSVMCPWHHACFDIRNGALKEPPALKGIASYPVTVENGQIMVELEPVGKPAKVAKSSDATFIIIGGGAAGESAAEELRRNGFDGELILLSASSNTPVDRPNLSKDYLAGSAKPEWIPLHDESWYTDHRIDLHLNTRVKAINPTAHTLTTDNGKTYQYDKLLLATGSQPRTLSGVDGADLSNILTLRSKPDADAILDKLVVDDEVKGEVVIIGASFIGMEVAASLGQRGAQVTVVEMLNTPFEPVMGERIGRFFQKLHADNGVQFKMDTGVAKFHGDNGSVSAVELSDGTKLPAKVVIVGIGVTPATDFLSDSGIAIHEKDNAVLVDQYLQTSNPDIYAVGDIARYPTDKGQTARIEHWRVAQQHGMIAAHNMLDSDDYVYDHVPFFWTEQWGTRMRYVGFAPHWDEIVYRGDVEDGEFIAFYLHNDRLIAAAGIGHDTEMAALEFVLKDNLPLSKEQMMSPDFDLVALASAE